MSKYDLQYATSNSGEFKIENMLAEGENVIWQGKPKKSAFVINKSITMLPIALIWFLFDGGFIAAICASGALAEDPKILLFIVPFFAFHLMPVWIWLKNTITAGQHWKNTVYAVTDRRIIIQSGFLNMEFQTVSYKDIHNVTLHIGIIDRILGVGDLLFDTGYGAHEKGVSQAFLDIEDAAQLYPKIQKIVLDIQSDIEYPNDLRPAENHGYRTEYKG